MKSKQKMKDSSSTSEDEDKVHDFTRKSRAKKKAQEEKEVC